MILYRILPVAPEPDCAPRVYEPVPESPCEKCRDNATCKTERRSFVRYVNNYGQNCARGWNPDDRGRPPTPQCAAKQKRDMTRKYLNPWTRNKQKRGTAK